MLRQPNVLEGSFHLDALLSSDSGMLGRLNRVGMGAFTLRNKKKRYGMADALAKITVLRTPCSPKPIIGRASSLIKHLLDLKVYKDFSLHWNSCKTGRQAKNCKTSRTTLQKTSSIPSPHSCYAINI